MTDVLTFVAFLPVLLFSIVAHEYAHGWVALREGDDTAARAGRLTLNPLPHIDLFGSVIVPLLLFLAPGGFIFGWARPVPVDPSRYREPRAGDIRVSMAGIAVNLILAVVCVVIMFGLTHAQGAVGGGGLVDLLRRMAFFGVVLNLILAFFNLIPVPPLDGSHVMYQLLPPDLADQYRRVGRFGFLALLAFLFLVPGASRVFMWPVDVFLGLFEPLIQP